MAFSHFRDEVVEDLVDNHILDDSLASDEDEMQTAVVVHAAAAVDAVVAFVLLIPEEVVQDFLNDQYTLRIPVHH